MRLIHWFDVRDRRGGGCRLLWWWLWSLASSGMIIDPSDHPRSFRIISFPARGGEIGFE